METKFPTGERPLLGRRDRKLKKESSPILLKDVVISEAQRIKTGIEEFDRTLGGGFVPGQVVLLAGEPGIGKSTLLLQIAEALAHKSLLYVSGEESPEQIKLRADRLGIEAENITLFSETDLDLIIDQIRKKRSMFIIIDSIQTLEDRNIASTSGSIAQVKECALRLQLLAKSENKTLILIGHITKEGAIAGPKVLEHLVDAVLYLEGDPTHSFRVLRVVKNRFGSADELGVFEMTEIGLREIKEPSQIFLEQRLRESIGSSVVVTLKGKKVFLLELQALTSPSIFTYPKRTVNGFDFNRTLMIIAVLGKKLNFNLHQMDVYVNVAGGIKIDEVGADLGVALALISSLKGKPLGDVATFGEVGLSGEIRNVLQMEKRIREAERLGYRKVIGPHNVRTVEEAVAAVIGK